MTTIDSTWESEDTGLEHDIKITFTYYPGYASTSMEPEEPETLEIEEVWILLADKKTRTALYIPWKKWDEGEIDNSPLEEDCWKWLKLQEEAREAAIEDYHEDRRRAMH